jgi:hypothetical protein
MGHINFNRVDRRRLRRNMETQLVRTTEALKKLLLGNDLGVIDCEAQTKVWKTFSKVEQDAIRERYHISYEANTGLHKSGDDAAEAGSLLAWAEMLEGATETVRALAKLGLEIAEADVVFVRLTGPVEKLEEAVCAGLADRSFYLDDEG